jgi:hypothetical protein
LRPHRASAELERRTCARYGLARFKQFRQQEEKDMTALHDRIIAYFRQTYSRVVVILSPPRCSSTALARVFWENPEIRHYLHEPFEAAYYRSQPLAGVFAGMQAPLRLRDLKKHTADVLGQGIVIKEMPYQVGDHFALLARLATAPLIFLIRDPRLNISSRMIMKEEVGDSPVFPLVESGWQLLRAQIGACQASGTPFSIVDSRGFRNQPDIVLRELCTRSGLAYTEALLTWRSQRIDIDNLDGKHSHLYAKVLRSKGLLPDDDPMPADDFFAGKGAFARHVDECLTIYEEIRALPQMILPTQEETGLAP